MTSKFFAIDPAGNHHKRTSQSRNYTHTVVVQRSKENAIAQAHASVASHIKQAQEEFANAARSIEENKAFLIAKRCGILARNDEYAIKMIAEGKAFAAKYGSPEGYAQFVLENQLAQIEATDWTVWHNQGWCGRRDLAEKLAAQSRGERHAAVVILNADRAA